ncbi:conserved hypothetical protein [Thioalkalivibrio sulfidiphilus HL-EbGr7]|uniref:Dienelactone hydrolase domain-containing protein n=1 Tax=Thioalkalivibrio sulfidiphilus (strain HL-EbGR7) TaxID=396588 RepID=B8GS68_THISH|nr:dienelactone hydrolase family protein [Thioalkalivibrio sulfidiphilus]ACL72772.1 conserved hypothetical protein [Thioalkalivibrio sulfidiphilus HL-EbGr7]
MNIEHRELDIQAGTLSLPGILALPSPARGIVVFAHGSGSSRFSSRNRFVADILNRAGLATLLFDLLSAEEHEVDQFTREYRFDIPRLGDRMIATVDWLKSQADLGALSLGLFGASTGAAAALIAAAARPVEVAAVVSRGGRPDLAGASLPLVQAPTLFIVGGLDGPVIDLNRGAAGRLHCEHHLEIVPGATHLFEEPGTLEQAAGHARDWFVKYLSS